MVKKNNNKKKNKSGKFGVQWDGNVNGALRFHHHFKHIYITITHGCIPKVTLETLHDASGSVNSKIVFYAFLIDRLPALNEMGKELFRAPNARQGMAVHEGIAVRYGQTLKTRT